MHLRSVTIDELRAVMTEAPGVVYVPVSKTPHFSFANELIASVREGREFSPETTEYMEFCRMQCRTPGGFFGAYGDIGCLRRCHEFAATILSIYEHGGVENIPTVHRKDGEFYLIHDGHHRIAALAAMGYKTFMVNERDETLGDSRTHEAVKYFDGLLTRINNGRRETYQPLPPGFGRGFTLGRHCHGRLKMLLEAIPEGSTVLDIGACLGFFTRELAKAKRPTHAVEIDPRYCEAMDILERADPSGATYQHADFISGSVTGKYDFVLCLAVMHHIIKDRPAEAVAAVKRLDELAVKGLILEYGTDSEDWLKGRNINRDAVEKLISENTSFKIAKVLGRTRWGTRDVCLLTRDVL